MTIILELAEAELQRLRKLVVTAESRETDMRNMLAAHVARTNANEKVFTDMIADLNGKLLGTDRK